MHLKRLHCPTRSAREHRKIRVGGDTDVDVSIEVAVSTWVACDGVDQTCHSIVDALVLAVNKTSPSTADIFLRDKRNSDDLCIYSWVEGCNACLFWPSDPP